MTSKRHRKHRIGKTFAVLSLALLTLLLCRSADAASYEEGLAAFDKRNYAVALQEWQPLAEAGDARSQHGMGLLAEIGVPKRDYVAAAIWYKKAADQGLPASLTNLGILYAEGRGVDKSLDQAAALWKTAADAGHPVAQFNLALLYYRGEGGLTQNFNDAAWWFAQSASQGSPDAQYALAELYRAGRGVPRNLTEAKRWYEQAAANGYPQARDRLASLDLEMQNQPPAPLGAAETGETAPAPAPLAATPPPETSAPTTTSEAPAAAPAAEATAPAAAPAAATETTAPAAGTGDAFNPTPKPFVPTANALAAGQSTAQPAPEATAPAPAAPLAASPDAQPSTETAPAEPLIASPATAPSATASTQPLVASPGTAPTGEAAPATTEATAPEAPTEASTDQAAVPVPTLNEPSDGVIRVWLSSAKTESSAATYWQNLQQTFPDLLGSLQPTIRRVDLGGDLGIWFRVLGGPLQNRASADQLCRELLSRSSQESCMVVVN